MMISTGKQHNTRRVQLAGVLTLLFSSALHATDELSCSLQVLDDIGWQVVNNSDIGFENTDTCNADITPIFKYNSVTEDPEQLAQRISHTFNSVTSKCLFNRNYSASVNTAVTKLIDNEQFKFLPTGPDPRDPFRPPDDTWDSKAAKGYDIPKSSILTSVESLYKKPFVAECSTAIQIAQLAALSEYYGNTTDKMLERSEVGIGTWKQFAKVPSIAARQSMFITRGDRSDDGLKKLAKAGKAAFYGQIGYLKPHKGPRYIDSLDNLGQNYMIVKISDLAVASLRAREQPVKELSKISRKIWKQYRKRQKAGETIEVLRQEMQQELEAADPFFRDVDVYVHPLYINNFAKHIARQFKYNPRTPYVFEVYEDYQTGFFYNRYIDHKISQCMSGTSQQ